MFINMYRGFIWLNIPKGSSNVFVNEKLGSGPVALQRVVTTLGVYFSLAVSVLNTEMMHVCVALNVLQLYCSKYTTCFTSICCFHLQGGGEVQNVVPNIWYLFGQAAIKL